VRWWWWWLGDEVTNEVAWLVCFDHGFSDRVSNLLRFAELLLSRWWFPNLLGFAGLYVSGLPILRRLFYPRVVLLVLWCLFHHHRSHGGTSVVAETCLPGFSFYFCLVSGPPDGAGSGFWWAERFWFKFGSQSLVVVTLSGVGDCYSNLESVGCLSVFGIRSWFY
jgi:hypothetical protein